MYTMSLTSHYIQLNNAYVGKEEKKQNMFSNFCWRILFFLHRFANRARRCSNFLPKCILRTRTAITWTRAYALNLFLAAFECVTNSNCRYGIIASDSRVLGHYVRCSSNASVHFSLQEHRFVCARATTTSTTTKIYLPFVISVKFNNFFFRSSLLS